MAETPAGNGDTQSPLAAAADRIRESAKWLLGAFAAVGALLAAGLQLADIGSVSADSPGRLLATAVGLILTVGAIIYAIGCAGGVATVSYVSMKALSDDTDYQKVRDEINADTNLLKPAASVWDLRTKTEAAIDKTFAEYDKYVEARDEANDAAQTAERLNRVAAALPVADPKKGDATLQASAATEQAQNAADQAKAAASDVTTAQATADRLAQTRSNVLGVASFLRVRNAYEDVRTKLAGAAIATTVGLLAFAWGANAPKSEGIDGGEVLPKTPSDVTLVLNDSAQQEYKGRLGDACDLQNIPAIALSVSGSTYDVVTVPSKTCKTVKFSVAPSQGKVIPRVDTKEDQQK